MSRETMELSEKDIEIKPEESKKFSAKEIDAVIRETDYFKKKNESAMELEEKAVDNQDDFGQTDYMEIYKNLGKWFENKKKETEKIAAELEKDGDTEKIEEAIKELQKVIEEANAGIEIRKGILKLHEEKNKEK